MFLLRNRLFLPTLFLLTSSQVIADEQTKTSDAVANDLTPKVGKATRGSHLVGTPLWSHENQKLGKIVDLWIDPYFAKVSCLVVEPYNSIAHRPRLLVPVELVEFCGEKATTSLDAKAIGSMARPSPEQANSIEYTRDSAMATYRVHGLQPYWDKQHNEDDITGNSAATKNDRFFLLTQLKEARVADAAGEKLGHIMDAVISTSDGKVLYVLLNHQQQTDSDESTMTIPVPLAAFVVPTGTGEWFIDLPEELLDTTQAVENGKLPAEINRGWVEYVHVKYGGGVFDGVQREAKR